MKRQLLLMIISLVVLAGCGQSEDSESVDESTNEEFEAAMEEVNNDEPEAEAEVEEAPADELPEEISDLNLSDVRNDETGEWQVAVTSNDINMPENAVAYYEAYMEGGGPHYIISFATNTTTMINDMGGMLDVTITEYVDGEEHDASVLGSGMLLDSYIVDTEDGSIE